MGAEKGSAPPWQAAAWRCDERSEGTALCVWCLKKGSLHSGRKLRPVLSSQCFVFTMRQHTFMCCVCSRLLVSPS